nr:hypothetical protein [Tanacetum cinerariifolium]
MSRDVITVGLTMQIPMLYRGEYSQWREWFMNYLEEQTDGEAMINSIQNGDQPLPVIAQVSLAGNAQNAPPTLKDPKFWTDEEKRTRKIDRLVRSLLIQWLLNDIYSLIDSNETAKDLWDALERQMRGSEYGEQDRKATILYEYETFKANEGEQLLDTYLRYLQVINDLKKCGYKKDNYELNYKFLNNLQPEWKQYDPLALVAEKMNVSKRKEKVAVSSDSKGSGADDFSELKKITALLAKALNRRKFYSKPTNNNLRTSSTSQSANKKQEFVKSDDKKVDKKANEKKRDMSKVKCYNYKKEDHFAKDCKKAKVKDYNYYKTKMLLAKKDSDEQVLFAEDQAWMESSSDFDQKINANMVLMAQIEKVLSESDKSSSSAEETIVEVAYYTFESESESEFETLEYYDNSTNHGLFVKNDDDQEIFHDAIEFASENFIENHIDSQKDYDKCEVDHNDSKEKEHLVDKLIRKFNHKIAKCQKRIEKANQQSKDLENQNKDFQEKYHVLLNQVNTFKKKNNEFNEQIKVLNENNADLLDQTEVLHDQLKVKHVVIDTHTEYQEQYAKLEEERYEYMIRYSVLFDNDKQNRKQIADQEVLFDKMSVELVELDKHVRDLKNTVLEKDFKISELEECVCNKDLEIEKCLERLNVCENKLHKIGQTNQTVHMIMPSKDNLYNGRKGISFENPSYFEKAKDLRPTLYDEKQTSSLKPYVPNVILEKIIIDLEDEVVSLLEKEKANLKTIEYLKSKGFESSENAISKSEDQSENDCFVVEKECDKVENPKVIAPGMFKLSVSQSVSPNSMSKTSCDCKNVENCPDLSLDHRFGMFKAYDGVGQFCDKGLEVAFRTSACFVRNEDGVDLLTRDRSSNMYTTLNEVASNSSTFLLAKASSSQSWLWHQRFFHLNFTTINNLVKNNLVQGLPKMKFEKDYLCSACEQGKILRKHHKSKTTFALNKPLYLLHMDLCSPMALKKTQVNLQLQVQRVRTDNGTEFKNKTLAKFFDEVGITQQFSAARTPQQNGVVEKRNRTLVEAARTMLTFANLPSFIWAEAIATACFPQNCSIIHKRFDKTPYELINKRKPNIKFFRVFGCRCYLLNDYEDVGKLKANGDIGVFVGYSKESVAFKIYNKQTHKIHEGVNVNFDEILEMASKQFSLEPGLSNLNRNGKIFKSISLTSF